MEGGLPFLDLIPSQGDSILPNGVAPSSVLPITYTPVVNGTIYPDLISPTDCGLGLLFPDVGKGKKRYRSSLIWKR